MASAGRGVGIPAEASAAGIEAEPTTISAPPEPVDLRAGLGAALGSTPPPPTSTPGVDAEGFFDEQPTTMMDRDAMGLLEGLPGSADHAPADPPAAPEPNALARGANDFLGEGQLGLLREMDAPVSAASTPAPVAPAPASPSASPSAGRGTDAIDAAVRAVAAAGLLDAPDEAAHAEWAAAPPRNSGGKRRLVFAFGGLALLLVGSVGGWYAYRQQKNARAAELVVQAREAVDAAQMARLAEARDALREARTLDARAPGLEEARLRLGLTAWAFDATTDVAPLRQLTEGVSEPDALQRAASAILEIRPGQSEPARAAATALSNEEGVDALAAYVAAMILERVHDPEALAAFERARTAHPDHAPTRVALARAKLLAGDEAGAREALGEAGERADAQLLAALLDANDAAPEEILAKVARGLPDPERASPIDRVVAALATARAHRRAGADEPARAAVEEAAGIDTGEPRLTGMVAREAHAVGLDERALALARSALGPDALPALRVLFAELSLDAGDPKGALDALGPVAHDVPRVLELSTRAALRLGGAVLEAAATALESPEGVTMNALALRVRAARGGSSPRLLRDAKRLVRRNEDDADARLALAEVALESSALDDAASALAWLVERDAEDAHLAYLQGRLAVRRGQAAEARTAFDQAIARDARRTDVRVSLGYLLLDSGEFEAAEAHYVDLGRRQFASGASARVSALFGRVEALVGLGRLDDAAVQFERIPEEARERASGKLLGARLALAQGRASDALTATSALVASAPSATLLALHGDALSAAGRTAEAGAAYERALGLDGGHPEALLGYATTLLRGEKADDAADILERASRALEARIRPPSLRTRLDILVGRVHHAKGDRRAAVESLTRVSEAEGAPAEVFFYLGEAQAGVNSPAARAAYQAYLERAPEGPFAARARRALE